MIKWFNTKSNKCVLFNNFRRDNLSHDILKYICDNLNMHCDTAPLQFLNDYVYIRMNFYNYSVLPSSPFSVNGSSTLFKPRP